MSERKINLEEIWSKYKKFSKAPNLPGAIDLGYFKPIVNAMMLEFSKQLLELAAENAKAENSGATSDSSGRIISGKTYVIKETIIDTINQVE